MAIIYGLQRKVSEFLMTCQENCKGIPVDWKKGMDFMEYSSFEKYWLGAEFMIFKITSWHNFNYIEKYSPLPSPSVVSAIDFKILKSCAQGLCMKKF